MVQTNTRNIRSQRPKGSLHKGLDYTCLALFGVWPIFLFLLSCTSIPMDYKDHQLHMYAQEHESGCVYCKEDKKFIYDAKK